MPSQQGAAPTCMALHAQGRPVQRMWYCFAWWESITTAHAGEVAQQPRRGQSYHLAVAGHGVCMQQQPALWCACKVAGLAWPVPCPYWHTSCVYSGPYQHIAGQANG